MLVHSKGELAISNSCMNRTNAGPQGESYPEGKPSTIEYQCDIPVSYGHTPQTTIEIFSNNDSGKTPVHLDSSTKFIGTLSLDLRRIPRSAVAGAPMRRMGLHRYYCLEGVIEARYGSAEITYTVKLGGRYHSIVIARFLVLTLVQV